MLKVAAPARRCRAATKPARREEEQRRPGRSPPARWENQQANTILHNTTRHTQAEHAAITHTGEAARAIMDGMDQHIDGDALTRDWNDLAPELQARIQAGIAQAERGETVSLGDFQQHLDDEPFADTDLDGPEARTTTLNADDYQRLLDGLDDEDAQYRQAMRARKRGRPEA